jgi:hypothetical protein
MNTPADKTAKRISVEEWFARYDAIELLKQVRSERGRLLQQVLAPADRIAVRA